MAQTATEPKTSTFMTFLAPRSCLRLPEAEEVVDGAVAVAERVGRLQGFGDVRLRHRDRDAHALALGEGGGDRRGEGAAGAVRARRVDAGGGVLVELCAVVEQVRRRACWTHPDDHMAALHHDRL